MHIYQLVLDFAAYVIDLQCCKCVFGGVDAMHIYQLVLDFAWFRTLM